MSTIHRFYLRFNQLFFVVFLPRNFFFQFLFQENIGFTVLIHVLQKIHTGLIFASPLRLSCIPLFFIFLLSKLVNMAFVGGFIVLDFVVVLLQFLDFSTTGEALCLFKFLHSTFSC